MAGKEAHKLTVYESLLTNGLYKLLLRGLIPSLVVC